MVLSKINDEISYKELKTIDENDKGRDVSMYQINLFKIPIVIALGEIKYTFVEQNVLFTPVYLVVDDHNNDQAAIAFASACMDRSQPLSRQRPFVQPLY